MGCGASNTASVAAGASDSSIIDPEEKEKAEKGKHFGSFFRLSPFPSLPFPNLYFCHLFLSAFHFFTMTNLASITCLSVLLLLLTFSCPREENGGYRKVGSNWS